MSRRSERIIKQAYERLARIRTSLNEIDYLSSGTLLERMKVCGNANCRCHRDPSGRHGPHYQWDRMKGGKLVHRNVTPEQAAFVRRAIANYRNVKKLLKAWEHETERLMDNEIARKP